MFEFVPVVLYVRFYYYFLLGLILIVFFRSNSAIITDSKVIKNNQFLSMIVLVIVTLYIGFRPLSWLFGDMETYARIFERYQNNETNVFKEDFVFDTFTEICANTMTIDFFFLLCAVLYVFPLWSACQSWFKEYAFYAFLALIASFSFWSFGTNGIRNGIATSVFLYALSRKKIVFQVLFIVIAAGIHKSVIIPAAAFALTFFYANPKKYFFAWLFCIPLSLVSGGFWEGLFAGFMTDDRMSYLTAGNVNNDDFSSTGFRWDFLLYSASAAYAAYFFIFKKNFVNPVYNQLVCVYLAANGFWILVIRANFSNRFAYLSWFMMGIVICYPFLTKIQVKNQHQVLGTVLLLYFGFTYLMNVVLV